MTREFKSGDRVGYTKPWLQSVTGGDPYSGLWSYRGTVMGWEGRWVRVQWDHEIGREIGYVHPANIAQVGSFAFAHADAKGWTGYEALGGKARNPFSRKP